jgi:hypothetical protein
MNDGIELKKYAEMLDKTYDLLNLAKSNKNFENEIAAKILEYKIMLIKSLIKKKIKLRFMKGNRTRINS